MRLTPIVLTILSVLALASAAPVRTEWPDKPEKLVLEEHGAIKAYSAKAAEANSPASRQRYQNNALNAARLLKSPFGDMRPDPKPDDPHAQEKLSQKIKFHKDMAELAANDQEQAETQSDHAKRIHDSAISQSFVEKNNAEVRKYERMRQKYPGGSDD
jgi:hypothetical protein